MFGLKLFETEKGKERVEIYYHQMTPMVKQITALVQNEKPVLYGVHEAEKCLLDLNDIYYFDIADRRTFAYTKDKVYQVSKSLAVLEEELHPFGFVRINKSNLVNIYLIKKIKPEANMRIMAVLKNDEKIQINRGYKRAFEEYLKEIRKMI